MPCRRGYSVLPVVYRQVIPRLIFQPVAVVKTAQSYLYWNIILLCPDLLLAKKAEVLCIMVGRDIVNGRCETRLKVSLNYN